MRHHHKRPAVSEIVGVLLMLAIVVSLGVLIFAAANGGMNSLSGNYATAMSNQGKAVSEGFTVEQATFCFTTSCAAACSPTCVLGADVYVRNVGTTPATLVSVYITDVTANAFVSQTTISTTVNVGTFVDVPHATLAFTPAHGHTYSFTVTSSFGNSVVFSSEAS